MLVSFPRSLTMTLAAADDVKTVWSEQITDITTIWLTYDSDDLCRYVFNELDLVWSREEYHHYSYIQYDLPLVLQQIAEIQVRVFKRTLPACVISYIAAFACEVLTYDDVSEEDDCARGKICMAGGSKRCKRST